MSRYALKRMAHPTKRTVRLTTANDRRLMKLCLKLGLDINGVFNLAIAKLAESEALD